MVQAINEVSINIKMYFSFLVFKEEVFTYVEHIQNKLVILKYVIFKKIRNWIILLVESARAF